MSRRLIIVRCGEQQDAIFPAKAKNAYTHNSFKWYRRYAEKYGDRWVILSTLKGFVDPEEIYQTSYNAKKFKITGSKMLEQIKKMRLDEFDQIEVLAGKEYVQVVKSLFIGKSIEYNLAGLKIGEKTSKVKRALAQNKLLSEI